MAKRQGDSVRATPARARPRRGLDLAIKKYARITGRNHEANNVIAAKNVNKKHEKQATRRARPRRGLVLANNVIGNARKNSAASK
jgi:hypothetical protein